MVAEDSLSGLQFPGWESTLVDRFFRYQQLRLDIEAGKFPMKDVLVLCLMIGQADTFTHDQDVLEEVAKFIAAARKVRLDSWMVLVSPFPRRDDDARRVRKLHAVGAHFHMFTQQPRVIYCTAAEVFSTPAGLNRSLLSETGLMDRGLVVIRDRVFECMHANRLEPRPDLVVTVSYK